MALPLVRRRFVPFDPDQFNYIDFCYKAQVWCLITHMNSTMCFYAQPLRYQEYTNLVAQPGAKLQAVHLSLLRVVIYNDQKRDRYVRAKILYINGKECDLFAIDFGYILKSIPVQDLYEPYCTTPVVPLAIHCQLVNCNFLENQTDNKAVRAFCEYIQTGNCLITIVGNMHGKYLVKVLNNYGQDVVEMMTLTDHFGFAFSNNEINRTTCRASAKRFFTYKAIEAGAKIMVKILTGKSLEKFFVADLKDLNNDLYIDEIYKNDLNDLDVSQLQKFFPVLAYLKRSKYFGRGVIQCIHEEQQSADIYFIDEGKIERVPWRDLKEVPKALFSINAVAIKCTAIKGQLHDFRCQKYLSPDQKFFITLKQPASSENNINTVFVSDH